MDNKNLEQFIRRHLEQVKQTPDPDVWDGIFAAQAPQNSRLRWKKRLAWLLPTAAAAVVVAILIWPSGTSTLPCHQTPEEEGVALPRIEHRAPVPTTEREAASAPTPRTRHLPGAMAFNKVPAQTLTFDAQAGLAYENPNTGTQIHIPAKALVDAAGRPVQGKVSCALREYRSIADYLASGIPMHFADERGTFFFNSGGMFEVRVEQNGQPLYMAPGQTYQVSFAPTHPLTNANFFYLDEQQGRWEYIPVPTSQGEAPPSMARVVSAADASSNNLRLDPCILALSERVRPSRPTFGKMRNGILTGHHLATGKMTMPKWFMKNPGLSVEAILTNMDYGAVYLVHDRDNEDKFFPQDRNGTLTELAVFKDCYFVKTADTPQVDLKQIKNTYYKGFWVIFDGGSRCKVEMLTDKGDRFNFYATLRSSQNMPLDVEKVMERYRQLRHERLEAQRQTAAALKDFLQVAPLFWEREEWCMSDTLWLKWFEANKTRMAQRYENLISEGIAEDSARADEMARQQVGAMRAYYTEQLRAIRANTTNSLTLRLAGFGLYNYDQIYRLGEPQGRIFAQFRASNGAPIGPLQVILIDRETKLCFSLPDRSDLPLWPDRALDIFVTDQHGRRFHLSAERYAYLTQSPPKTAASPVVVEDITARTQTVGDWTRYLIEQDIAL